MSVGYHYWLQTGRRTCTRRQEQREIRGVGTRATVRWPFKPLSIRKNADVIQKGWLNLSLGPYPGSNSRSTASMKVYTCSYCKRKFYSSQALGGHQNAHRRERDAVRKYNLSKTTNFTVNQSLQVHSLDGETTVAMFTDKEVSCGQSYGGELEAVNLKWPGSFYMNSQPDSMQPDHPHMLDLNLKL